MKIKMFFPLYKGNTDLSSFHFLNFRNITDEYKTARIFLHYNKYVHLLRSGEESPDKGAKDQ